MRARARAYVCRHVHAHACARSCIHGVRPSVGAREPVHLCLQDGECALARACACAWHGTARHGTAPHRTTRPGTARRATARRMARQDGTVDSAALPGMAGHGTGDGTTARYVARVGLRLSYGERDGPSRSVARLRIIDTRRQTGGRVLLPHPLVRTGAIDISPEPAVRFHSVRVLQGQAPVVRMDQKSWPL